MRFALIVTLFLGLAVPGLAQDAVDVDPEHHKVEFENDLVRVVRMTYPPAYKTPMHSHLSGVSVILSTATVHSWTDGGEESEAETTAGAAAWSEGGAVHANETQGDVALELIRVELKGNGTNAVPVPANDAVSVDPEHHKVEFENDQVRVVRMTYPPAYKTPMHSHLSGVSVILSSATVHSWTDDGEEAEAETTAGAAAWSDGGDVHANETQGDVPLELIRVELKQNGS